MGVALPSGGILCLHAVHFQIDVDGASLDNMGPERPETLVGRAGPRVRRVAGLWPAVRGRDALVTKEQGQDALATKEVYYGDVLVGGADGDVGAGRGVGDVPTWRGP